MWTSLSPLLVFTVVPHVYAGTVLAVALRKTGGPASWADSAFSWRRFYVLMGWAPLTYLALGLFVSSRYLAMFVVSGIAGVLGELFVSVVWRLFFTVPIWTYSHGAFAAGFSSTLNFLPWAVGAFLFHAVATLVGAGAPVDRYGLLPTLGVSVAALAGGALVSFPAYALARARRLVKPAFSSLGLAALCFPILCAAVALTVLVDWRFLPLMLAFSVVGFVTEYGYGRVMSEFFTRGLWRYNPWPLDHGHASPVSLPLWALGGLFFFFISHALVGT